MQDLPELGPDAPEDWWSGSDNHTDYSEFSDDEG